MIPDFATRLLIVTVVVLVWLGALAAYRLYFSPLARFPGPTLAALTGWYETYYDCIKEGSFWIQVEQMHKQYGKHLYYSFNPVAQLRHLTALSRTNCTHQPLGITCQ